MSTGIRGVIAHYCLSIIYHRKPFTFAQVVGANGKSVEDGYRTSYGTFLKRYQDDVVRRIENRIAGVCGGSAGVCGGSAGVSVGSGLCYFPGA